MAIDEASKRISGDSFAYPSSSHSYSRNSSSHSEVKNAKCPFASEQHEGKEMINTSLRLSPQTVFKYIFQDDSFLNKLYANRKYDDRVSTEWEKNSENGNQTRKVTYKATLPSKALGPSFSFVTEYQTLSSANIDNELYVNNSEVINEGIPYGDSFLINIHYCILRETSTNPEVPQSHFSFWVQVTFKKSPFFVIKNLIERSALDGMETLIKDIVEQLKIESEKMYGSALSAPRQRGVHTETDRRNQDKKRKMKKPPLPPPQKSIWKSSSVILVYFLLLLLGAMNAYLMNRMIGLERTTDGHFNEPNSLRGSDQAATVASLRISLHEMELQESFLNKYFDKWKDRMDEAYRGLRTAEDAIVEIKSLLPEYEREWKELFSSTKENHTRRSLSES